VLSTLSYIAFLGAASGSPAMCAVPLAMALALWLGSVVHVALARRNAGRTPRTSAVVVASLALLVVGNLEGMAYRRTVAEAFKIPSGSMIPTLQVGDHLFVDKRAVTPKRGDVVVYNYMRDPSKQFIKRCVAIGGDIVELHDEVISVNGVPLDDKPVPGLCAYEDYDEDQDRWVSRRCRAYPSRRLLGARRQPRQQP
jgi:signal peptidase I